VTTDTRNLEARRLIADTITGKEEAFDRAKREGDSAYRKSQRLDEECTSIKKELEGLRQALDALGGPPPADEQPEAK